MDLHPQGLGDDVAAPGVQPPAGKHPHRPGRPASWLLVAVIVVAFLGGAFAVLDEAWPLFWVSLAVLVLAVPASRLLGTVRDAVLAGDLPGPGVPIAPAPVVAAEQPAVPS